MAKQIPVVVVAGFLGSGKTTLLNHLLTTAGGTRIGVLVNDFGSVNVDAMAVAGQVDSTISLSNGCLCCAVDVSELDDMLARLAKPAAGIDVIVIEASGLAEPETMVKMVLATGNQRLGYGGLVLVVDAAEFTTTSTRHPELLKHLRLADLVVLNKSDRAEDLPALRREVERHTPGTPVVEADHARVDPALLFDPRPRERKFGQLSFEDLAEPHDDHVHALYTSVEFTTGVPVHPRRFMDFLDDRPAGLYRMKGSVHFGARGHHQRYTLHTVGDYLRFEPTTGGSTTRLVMIGTDLDAESITTRLEACTTDTPADPRTMLDVLRYLRA
ncbi:GTP-binding protein [Umezawaea sp. Da 62-37]|uniref:CobW family GTP-binding protein n=1 Tax=Umezawaea sp. Da 62-37 TaxID=3075927 RepID=UPI0028F71AFA|nr:GTP-binding protein [Umezawaea sp. Da 62-37]WNV91129.1 GTP-binding protein [Umezawaea sp. Da 62-37]